jgi:hypothetical protein
MATEPRTERVFTAINASAVALIPTTCMDETRAAGAVAAPQRGTWPPSGSVLRCFARNGSTTDGGRR